MTSIETVPMRSAKQSALYSWRELALVFFVLVLFVVWPVPATNSLRSLAQLTILGLVLASPRGWLAAWATGFRTQLIILALLSAWLFFGALQSDYYHYALREFVSQWFRPCVLFGVGLLCAVFAWRRQRVRAAAVVLLVGLLFPVLYTVAVDGIWNLIVAGHVAPDSSLNSKTTVSYCIDLAFAIGLAEAVLRVRDRQPQVLLPLSNYLLAALLTLSLAAEFIAHARNSLLSVGLLIAVAAFLVYWKLTARLSRIYRMAFVLLVVAGIGVFGYATYKIDPRWQKFSSTVPIAWDTETHTAWHHPVSDWLEQSSIRPQLPDGRQVDDSAYLRIAWFKEGAKLILAHPLGLGYGRDVFGFALHSSYGLGSLPSEPDGVPQGVPINAQSGLLELGIGTGIPGIVLMLALLITSLARGWRQYRDAGNPWALFLVFFLTEFLVRLLFDDTVRDHMFEEFMFIFGALAFCSLSPNADQARVARLR